MVTSKIKKQINKLVANCPICGNEFIKVQKTKKFCSVKCRDRNYQIVHKESVIKSINKWRDKNKDRVNKLARERYANNPKPFKEKAKKYLDKQTK